LEVTARPRPRSGQSDHPADAPAEERTYPRTFCRYGRRVARGVAVIGRPNWGIGRKASSPAICPTVAHRFSNLTVVMLGEADKVGDGKGIQLGKAA
jgi:hypothetical protein